MNPQTSAPHGATSSSLGTYLHFPTSKLPSSKPLLKPIQLVTPSTALHHSGGYYFTSTCSSSHHPQKSNATISPSATPSATELTQHIVVTLHSFSIRLCRFAGLNKTAAPHTPDTIAAHNRPQTTTSIELQFLELAHHNPLPPLDPQTSPMSKIYTPPPFQL